VWFDRKRGRIRCTDIAAADVDAEALGTTFDDLMSRIWARLPDGTWIEGLEVFRQFYSAAGFGLFAWVSRAPGLSHLLDWGYRWFAKNRLWLTGRCTKNVAGECFLPDS
jgi:hypothetical protein